MAPLQLDNLLEVAEPERGGLSSVPFEVDLSARRMLQALLGHGRGRAFGKQVLFANVITIAAGEIAARARRLCHDQVVGRHLEPVLE